MALTATPIKIAQFHVTTANNDDLLYTVSQPKVVIKEMMLTNHTGSNRNMSVAIVPQGETLGTSHYVFLNARVNDAESKLFTGLSIVLNTGDKIYVSAQQSNMSIYISGVEFTTI